MVYTKGMDPQSSGISWVVQTHEHRERSADWFWTLGLLAVVGAGISIYFSNVLLAVILVVGAGSIGFLAIRGPREHTVRIDARGVSIDGTLYQYSSIHTFGIAEGPHEPRLVLTTGSLLAPRIVLSLETTSPEVVRALLRRYLEEEEQQPIFSESVAELFGL